MKTISYEGNAYDYEIIVDYMNDEIREDLHAELAPCTEQEFFNAYMERDPEFMNEFKNDLYPVLK